MPLSLGVPIFSLIIPLGFSSDRQPQCEPLACVHKSTQKNALLHTGQIWTSLLVIECALEAGLPQTGGAEPGSISIASEAPAQEHRKKAS